MSYDEREVALAKRMIEVFGEDAVTQAGEPEIHTRDDLLWARWEREDRITWVRLDGEALVFLVVHAGVVHCGRLEPGAEKVDWELTLPAAPPELN